MTDKSTDKVHGLGLQTFTLAISCLCLSRLFGTLWKLEQKSFTDNQTTNTIQLVAAIKENFSGLFFF